jgi:hypothetical protein
VRGLLGQQFGCGVKDFAARPRWSAAPTLTGTRSLHVYVRPFTIR